MIISLFNSDTETSVNAFKSGYCIPIKIENYIIKELSNGLSNHQV